MVLGPQMISPLTSPRSLFPSDPPRRIGVGHVEVTPLVRDNVADVLRSGWLSPGRWCTRFEREWAALHQRRYAVFVNSGTSALQIAIAALKEKHAWPDGAGVIVPALTFVATVNVVTQNGLRPVFADVDPYYGIELCAPPPPGTVAVIPVHVNGQQCGMDRVMRYAADHGLAVVEDSCECVAASLGGRIAHGVISCYSTYAAHHVTTGVGGFACTDDENVAMLLRSLANHGRDGIYFDPLAAMEQLVARRFNFERAGYSYRASEFEAAVGCAQLPDLADGLERRREIADFFAGSLGDLPLVLPRPRPGAQWWPMFYPVLTPQRDDLALFLERHDVETRSFLPLTCQPVYRHLVRQDDFPAAKRVNEQGLYWGCHPGMSDGDLSRIDALVHQFFRR